MVTYTKSYYHIKELLNIFNIKTINLYILNYNYYYYILYYLFLIDDEPTVFSSKSFDHGIMDAILKSELYDKGKEGSSLLENNKIIIGVLIKFYSTV